jgi:hypothetical protein
MKKPFKFTAIGKIVIGVADAITGGTVSNVVYKDENSEAGKIDIKRAGSSIITILLMYLFATGKLSMEQVQQFLTIFGN